MNGQNTNRPNDSLPSKPSSTLSFTSLLSSLSSSPSLSLLPIPSAFVVSSGGDSGVATDDIVEVVSASANRGNACFDPIRTDPNGELRTYLQRVWHIMVYERLFLPVVVTSPKKNDGDDQRNPTDAEEGVKGIVTEWFETLWDLHTQDESRHYHTIVHVFEMILDLMLLTELPSPGFQQSLSDIEKSVLVLAIFFHDAVYNPRSSTNEDDSIELFQTFAMETQLASICNKNHVYPNVCRDVIQLIDATKHHDVSVDHSILMSLFLDMDMAVLGKTSTAYQSYAYLIRREYMHVPHDVYCAKRAELLESWLNGQPHLYGTLIFQQALGGQARANIQAEIAALRAGMVYSCDGGGGKEEEEEEEEEEEMAKANTNDTVVV